MAVQALTLALILALALALRLWRLGAVPPGLHVDEAHNGVDALAILRGARPLYVTGNNGREALLCYLQAATVGLFGPTPWALRLASAIAGTAAVGVAYGLARALPTSHPRRVAAATAFLMAVSVWPLHFSRIGIRGILMPLLGGAFAWALWRATGGSDSHPTHLTRAATPIALLRRHALAGALLGLALYAHPAARLMPLVPVLLLGARAAVAWRRGDRAAARRTIAGLAALAAAAVVVAAPLIAYALRHPDVFFGHSLSVSVVEADNRQGGLPRRLALNGWRTLRAFFWDGSDSWYHNVPGRAVFDPVTAVMAAVGAAGLARSAWATRPARAMGARRAVDEVARGDDRSAAGFIAAWLIVLALPAVLTGGAPNFSRSVGLMPVAFVVPAIGYAAASAALARLVRRERWVRWAAAALIALLIPAGLSTLHDYFGRYAGSREAAEAFGASTRARAEALRALALTGDGRVFAPSFVAERAVYRFLLDGAGVTPIDATGGLVVPADGPAWLVFDADDDGEAAGAVLERWPALRLTERFEVRGWRALRVEDVPRDTGNTVDRGDDFAGLTLVSVSGGVGCDAIPPERDLLCSNDAQTLDLALRWHVEAVPGRDWTAFAHLVAPDGRTVAQHDGAPLAGTLPTSRWRAGDTVVDRFTLAIPDGTPAGRYRLHVGWYEAASGERLALPGDPDGAADVAAVEVR